MLSRTRRDSLLSVDSPGQWLFVHWVKLVLKDWESFPSEGIFRSDIWMYQLSRPYQFMIPWSMGENIEMGVAVPPYL